MNLSYLKTFAAVVENRGFSRAAAELHLTQPAVTKHVQALESHFGRPLLAMAGREAVPTEEGRILYRYAQDVLRILAAAEAALAEAGDTLRGPLHLGASTIPGQYVLPHVIGPFRRAHPLLDLHLEVSDTHQVARKVAENKADVGVVGSQVKDRRLSTLPFVEDELAVIMPPNHPLAARDTVYARDLVSQPVVWRKAGSGTRKSVEDRLAEIGVTLDSKQRVLEVDSTEAAVAAVEAGLGWSIVSSWAVVKSITLGAVVAKRPADVSLKRKLFIIHPRHGASRAARAFTEFLQGPAGKEALKNMTSGTGV